MQNIKKYFMTLALLLTAVTGAWAQTAFGVKSLIVNPVVGQIIGSDGKNYDANATLPTGVTAVAMIAYVGNDAETSTTYNHGLALALGDVSDTKNWCSQTEAACLGTGHQFDSKAGAKGDMAGIDNTDALVNHTGHTHDAASAARNYNSGTHPAGTSAWFLPSAGQWDKMATAAGGYANLKTNASLQGDAYWSSTEGGASYAWFFDFSNGDWSTYGKDYDYQVRACLAFDIAEPTEWDLTSQDGKTWTLATMPASDIELQVEYFAESNLFLSKEALADKGSIAVTAGDLGVEFDDKGKSANTVTEGTAMTVKFNGTKKLLGMKVEKKAPTEGHALSASAVGEIVGSDGKAYAVADKDNLPSGVTAVAMVAYKSGSNGLAIQLNSSPVEKEWADADTYAKGLTAVTGGTWRLPSKADWQNMFVSCAVSGDASAGDTMNPIAGFKAKIAATGITWQTTGYWSSTGSGYNAWDVEVYLDGSNAAAYFYEEFTSSERKVLACLAF